MYESLLVQRPLEKDSSINSVFQRCEYHERFETENKGCMYSVRLRLVRVLKILGYVLPVLCHAAEKLKKDRNNTQVAECITKSGVNLQVTFQKHQHLMS